MRNSCDHMQFGWCVLCIEKLLERKDEQYHIMKRTADRVIKDCNNLQEWNQTIKTTAKEIVEERDILKKEIEIQTAVMKHNPKHGYGVPPLEKGLWFCFYKDKNKWAFTDNSDDFIEKWNSSITEYFGPISFVVWNTEKKIEEKTLQSKLDAMTLNPDLRGFLNNLTEAVMELQKESKE